VKRSITALVGRHGLHGRGDRFVDGSGRRHYGRLDENASDHEGLGGVTVSMGADKKEDRYDPSWQDHKEELFNRLVNESVSTASG
jgi:hypothetical protein